MSRSRNGNLEMLHTLILNTFDNTDNDASVLSALNHLDSACNQLRQDDISLDNKKAIVSEMRKDIVSIKKIHSTLYNKVNERLNGLIMDYALTQVAERQAAQISRQDADMKARQSVRTSGRSHQEQESAFLKSISAEVDGFSANQMAKLQTMCKGLMSAKLPADKHKIIAMIKTELTPGKKNTIDEDLSKRLLTELGELGKNYPQPVQPKKTKSLGLFGKKAAEPEQVKRVVPTGSAPGRLETSRPGKKK